MPTKPKAKRQPRPKPKPKPKRTIETHVSLPGRFREAGRYDRTFRQGTARLTSNGDTVQLDFPGMEEDGASALRVTLEDLQTALSLLSENVRVMPA